MPSLGLPTVGVVLRVFSVCVCARLDKWSSESVHACMCVRVRLHFCLMFSFACGWCVLACLFVCANLRSCVNALSARFLVCVSCTRRETRGSALSCLTDGANTRSAWVIVSALRCHWEVFALARELYIPPCMQLETIPRTTLYFITPTAV